MGLIAHVISGEMDHDDQRALVEAARRGDAAAWEALYLALHPRLRAYAARRVGAADADDVVSETITRAVAAIDRFRWERAGFDGWVFGIARRTSAEHVRRAERSRRVVGADDGVDSTTVDEDTMRAAEHAEVRRAFAHLRPDEREILELRVIAGLATEQVAAVLGKRPGAVRTAQSRALRHLRTEMGDRVGD